MEEGVRRITGARLIDHDGVVQDGDFLLHPDGSYSKSKGDEDVVENIDGSARLVTRSLQNWHTHLAMILNRSMGEGLPLMEWLETSIFPVEKFLTPEFVEVGTRAAAAELIATGTTFACDMYFHTEVIGETLAQTGLRAKLCGPITDGLTPNFEPGSGDALRHMENLIRGPSPRPGRIEYGIGAHSVYVCDEEILRKASDVAKATGCTLSIHTSETRTEVADCHAEHGMYPIEYLDSIDFFSDGSTVCAHCGWATKKEMRILAGHDAHAVHCPTSNQKLACGGTMSYPAMREAGVDVRLGTDGAASNNSLDMRAESKAASLVQRHDHWDARILDPVETWQLATKDSIDWVTWDLDDVRMRPWGRDSRRLLANLIYSGARCLDVVVGGQALRRDGVTLSVDESAAGSSLEDAVSEYYSQI
ncbi:MAG TPA: amidohydrolase family protein [Candidatus Thalassarchaeum sp.]|jgi:5-methylthioadenosine/S-adenosylhomocysteine deaminase|nr:amidohydrolase family protein [Candidatus Thalassarchaeum sp.]|tara:strand:- start:1857 stop:3113 length:1257 start_codon:yes stop_codon:yes gene_type:complete